MGRLVADRATAAGDAVVLRVGRHPSDPTELTRQLTDSAAQVVIDFSSPEAVVAHVRAAGAARTPIVVGTTGWNDRIDQVRRAVADCGGTMIFGANFSIGVNVFYRLVAAASSALSAAGGYDPFIEEQHHARKKDAPSGTALKLASIVRQTSGREVGVAVTRAGQITGTHRVGFDGAVDQLVLTHAAKSRVGFADGALFAARWIVAREPGVYEFDEAIEELIASRGKTTE
jgi:4-hydroxy-tetrahydrodipicolinate reductase